jgi:hypothetical protein
MAADILSQFILLKFHAIIWFNWGILYRFEEHDAPGSRSFFTEIIASVSDIKFARDGRHILSRDYMTLKVRRGRTVPSVEFLSVLLYMNFA